MPVLAVTWIGGYYRTTIPCDVGKLLGMGGEPSGVVFEDGKVIIWRARWQWQ